MALLSSDLVPSLTEMREIIKKIEAGEADIIIGTQMVAKGHHFPQLATVGIVDGDLGLGQRRPARGRAHVPAPAPGDRPRRPRARRAGRGFVQTYMPEHPVMQAIISGDREAFLAREIRQRQAGAAAALRPAGRARRLGPRQGAGRSCSPATSPTAPRRPTASRCWARPRRRWPSSAAATAGACWSRRRASSTCRPICAPGSTRLPKPPADLRLTVDIDPVQFPVSVTVRSAVHAVGHRARVKGLLFAAGRSRLRLLRAWRI